MHRKVKMGFFIGYTSVKIHDTLQFLLSYQLNSMRSTINKCRIWGVNEDMFEYSCLAQMGLSRKYKSNVSVLVALIIIYGFNLQCLVDLQY